MQCVRILDRLEKARMFHLYATLRDQKICLINQLVAEEDSLLAEVNPKSSWLSRALPNKKHIFSIWSIRNHFLKGIRSLDAKAVFHLTKQPNMGSVSIQDAAEHFALKDLPRAISDYALGLQQVGGQSFSGSNNCMNLAFTHIHMWYKCKIQLHSTFRPHLIMPAQTIQAYLSLPKTLYGNCDTVKLSCPNRQDFTPFPIVQVCIIFQVIVPKNTILNQHLAPALVYVQNFGFSGQWRDSRSIFAKENVDMYIVEWLFRNTLTADGERLRMGGVYPLHSIHILVDLIPVFGAVMDRHINASNSLKLPTKFYVNNFADKEMYNMF
ncbi:hypothetical protein SERLA73DRAFT_80118 [Serpula lacrymans var. lacrymans S7.3]|uniref:DUF6830 domain-containing protein n=2 Tax=Serpula lacrymans var. lacrymans TaxID=341189 RepID=F8QIR6_SERL3|nr:uncharacterized protein SERLADRAFT_435918 [Serpula lacrymans var. lacrymans S7.9]EGN91814.1 hypothetical protein SERLA73DRAFT_80118 [Serpula lacrymans var. lacrymans S7.3]EGO26070.1 hypothetical protein SERLADRAFT_435918 [Serpula lacrymans var. lacrymans S7.9]